MKNLGPDEIAKYPFLTQAKSYLADSGMTLETIGTDPDLQMIIDKAYSRIMTSARGDIYKSDIQDVNTAVLQKEILSFLVAVVLLKQSGMQSLIKRFSLQEAMRAERYLQKDLEHFARYDKDELAIKIIGELFSVSVYKKDNDYVLPVADYVVRAVEFYEREWKLINRRVEDGLVYLTAHEAVRLVRAELDKYIQKQIRSLNLPPMYPLFEKPVNDLISFAKKEFPSTVIVTTLEDPPCIKHAMGVLEKGENLPHSGRFMLATFLFSKGKSITEIAPLFKNAPDYKEKVTLYQLEHLSGSSGSATKYSCPSCDKLKSQNLCFATSQCDNIIHPSQFGTKRK